ncbi:unnamed protein product [Dibothriocephalus latus]|uniref:Chromo domain-containing protein n=1 Tax=Dibothriocephalus latus TaxID=60516 RepID=A0A3P7LK28_DIBLA|nr:unnamed protein product [Dibothriocephalus latus]
MSAKGDTHDSEDSEEIAEDEYQVERITKVRIRNGRKEYFLKWKGYPEEENTWEPEENLDCPDLIKEFEERMKKERGPATPSRASTSTASRGRGKSSTASPGSSSDAVVEPAKSKKRNRLSASAEEDEDSAPESKKSAEETPKSGTPSKTTRGFSRGLKPDRIIGATDSSGELMFLIKWKDSSEADLVPAREANVKCPQTVIRFYEERLTWHTPDTRGDSNVGTAFAANTTVPTTSTANETTQPVEAPPVQTSDGAAATVA